MPTLVRYLTTLTLLFTVCLVTLYVLAVFLEPKEREFTHEVLGLSIEE
ncbi:MAG: hypothetical protein DHS20C08_02600 [Rhodomicrobium sp.]|nr:MAG: hypothetical protein DHS20C08_02600 [Rhodomicrobium sp.]